MPWLDLSPVLANSFFTDGFIVIRRLQRVNQKGKSEPLVMGTYPDISGVVTPLGGNSLTRADAYETQDKAIQVITNFRLRSASKDAGQSNWMPDLIQWDGDTYIVRSLDDFSQYGAGFMVAECVSIDYNVAPADEEFPGPSLDLSVPAVAGVRMMMGWL